MAYGICFGSGTYIAPLYIPNNNKVTVLAVINRFLKGDKAGDSELLVHGDLGLYCRDQIIYGINYPLVVLPYGLACTFKGLSVFLKSRFFYMGRYIFHHRVKAHYYRCIGLFDVFYEFIDHLFFLPLILT